MKLIKANRKSLTVEMSVFDWRVISGMFCMINALQQPGWEDSTGQEDTAITPEQYDAVSGAWSALLNGPDGKDFFTGPVSDPFVNGGDSDIVTLISSAMPNADDVQDDDKIWVENSNSFLKVLAPYLVWKRDSDGLSLSNAAAKKETAFENIVKASRAPTVYAPTRKNLAAYLSALPGYSEIKTFDDSDPNFMVAKQQHGYRAMVVNKALEKLG